MSDGLSHIINKPLIYLKVSWANPPPKVQGTICLSAPASK